MIMPDTIPDDPEALRADVREKYRDVALFGGSGGEHNARAFDVSAHVFLAHRPA